MIHYLGQRNVSAADWNRRVDGFDVEGLARQLKSVGAGYLILSVGQNSGHYLAPNSVYDAYTGIKPSLCSRRDLMSDLSDALGRNSIRLMAYLPASAPEQDAQAVRKLDWHPGPDPNRVFQLRWQRVIRNWSLAWGKKVCGWWFDGCFWPNVMYRGSHEPDFASFAAAARSGNPDSLVAFNPGVITPVISIAPEEDYSAGETNDPFAISCRGRWLDGVQWHAMSFLGQWWATGGPRFGDEQISGWTRTQGIAGGVVTLDVPADEHGLIGNEFLAQLTAIGKSIPARTDR